MEVGYIENAEREAHDRGDMGKIYLFSWEFVFQYIVSVFHWCVAERIFFAHLQNFKHKTKY